MPQPTVSAFRVPGKTYVVYLLLHRWHRVLQTRNRRDARYLADQRGDENREGGSTSNHHLCSSRNCAVALELYAGLYFRPRALRGCARPLCFLPADSHHHHPRDRNLPRPQMAARGSQWVLPQRLTTLVPTSSCSVRLLTSSRSLLTTTFCNTHCTAARPGRRLPSDLAPEGLGQVARGRNRARVCLHA